MSKKDALAKGFAQVTKLPSPPRRTPVSENEARAFETDKTHSKKELVSRLRRAIGGARLAVYLPAELEQRLRVHCAMERRSISDAVTVAVTRWLADTEKPGRG